MPAPPHGARAAAPVIGLFGGAFDPIHHGHLAPVRQAARAAKLARVAYIPTARPAHRARPHAAARDRLEMARIALRDAPDCGVKFEVDDVELRMPGRSYTIETLAALRRKNPRARYALLLGMDALLGFEKWRRWRELRQSVCIIGIARAGWRAPRPPAWWREARAAGTLLLVEAEPVEISSTQVRAHIAGGGDASDLVPRGVWEYICARRLYHRAPAA
ncbi:MAG: nicotinate (nicotinamide) nucleotide adenylyltransferase [Gammaproteobacteria bacterium]|nr:nicotinate (nicotinamide) nucleotide adenylyltransferase [Gammaproteobacteria bacterium]CAJ2376395.1 MAG: putative nicotinate-nucleotide adenylyltransferase [Arenicellales bacterium IbO2]MDA7960981.1 nicotinate (nicotinamide) nucleotide adenylyltransferase [Gammaproteobacteria bacterium]MDA7970264.1 nicotinate (nicotinamide) nucleotide adenylyltransferase [Gammaproteobacteria bacterium]MDA7971911.1 nicotinate (nicotinamide) nucleotide adenylyltransferase [Gammaproteobacteria bacterium]